MATRQIAWVRRQMVAASPEIENSERRQSRRGKWDQFWMLNLRNLVGHPVEMTHRQADI